ncbi:MAG: LLM class flavin-dependent oxidoreductase [Pseudomonadota bacterium]
MCIGLLFNTDRMDRNEFIDYARRADAAGIEWLWLPELFTREPFATAGYLLAATERISLATGIANIYARDPVATVSAASALAELSQDRFLLGLGVSNAGLNEARGHVWQPPVRKLTEYLTAMRAVKLTSPQVHAPVHVAAHGPKMLATVAQHADGANTYLMPLAHVAEARAALGANKALNTMLFCLHDEDPQSARDTARRAVGYYMGLDYYHRAWRSFGFTQSDFDNGGSDALIDAIVAWGDLTAISERVAAQRAAGADQVVIIPIARGGAPDWALLERLVEA